MLKIPDGSYSNINSYVLGELHAKFGAFVRSVTIILKFDAKPPDYVYLSVVRPVLEYACPVWHTNLQQYLSDNIETIQKRALRCIFRGASYAEILSNVGLQTLKDRRDCICKKYFNSMKSETHKLHHLLPDERHVNYEMRQSKLYPLPKTRTNRYRNSFIPWGLRNCQ